MRQEVLFRVDANPQIGYGHLSRCTALAQMLSADFKKVLVSESLTISPHRLSNSFNEIFIIENDLEFYTILTGNEIVVIDNYKFDNKAFSLIKALGCKLVCIHDHCVENSYADVIFNHAFLHGLIHYKTALYNRQCLGNEYALLRPAFLNQPKINKRTQQEKTILIALGSAETLELINTILSALRITGIVWKVNLLSALPYTQLTRLMEDSNIIIHVHKDLNEDELIGVMQSCLLAILPASTLAIEAMSMGMGIILGISAENQHLLYKGCVENNCVLPIGEFNNVKPELLATHLIEYINSPKIDLHIENQSTFLTPAIIQNINKVFSSLQREFKVLFRQANLNDCACCFEWANDPQVRENSIQPDYIDWIDHEQWFLMKIEDKHSFYFLAELNGSPIASFRFKAIEDLNFEISYLLDKDFRGQGWASVLLKMAIERFSHYHPQGVTLIAWVKKSNTPSVKVFKNLSFVPHHGEFINGNEYLKFYKH